MRLARSTAAGGGSSSVRIVRAAAAARPAVVLALFLCASFVVGASGFSPPPLGAPLPSSLRLLRRPSPSPASASSVVARSKAAADEYAESSDGGGGEVTGIRLNKVFKATHSRRQADDLIADGRVTVNGAPVDAAGLRVAPFRDVVRLDGKVVKGWEALNHVSAASSSSSKSESNSSRQRKSAYEYIKYWKARGVTCTTDRSVRSNIIDRLRADGYRMKNRVYPVGRLDRDTSGLILLTSDGRLPNSALRGQYKQPKTYEVLIDAPVSEAQVQALRDGVVITTQAQRDRGRPPPLTARTKPCIVERLDGRRGRRLRMTIVEGRNRQIRKMVEAVGRHVVELHRAEFMRIRLDSLRGPGDWAPLSGKELDMVRNVIDKAERENGATQDRQS
mmetsp:Transcript_28071/g.82589  ORF Transcript_28071/g.82589 Transcript_28071/m.82589 type:complete len:390 (-) Transcript_28071:264-1433(-)